jgi:mannose-1-phosphate guanylyltransferase/mannose-6-phosphate isomerase
MAQVTPVLLCGGSGTRLWPLSRKSFPKQFAPLIGQHSLFQQAALRMVGPGFADPVVVTAAEYRFIVTEHLAAAGIVPGAILIEPQGRNTAPAILAAALHLSARDPGALMLVAPSDHAIPDAPAFRAAVEAAIPAALAGRIVTFGIRPTRAETGYGWLELVEKPTDFSRLPMALTAFVEKPDAEHAARMLDAGTFLWNAGIFLFTAETILAAYQAHAPDMIAPVAAALAKGTADLGFLRLARGPWAQAANISVDYAVMERAANLMCVPFSGDWSDLGDWQSVRRQMEPDADGNTTAGDVTAIDCKGSLLRSDADGLTLMAIGMSDVIAVAMNDAVLIAPLSRAQEVRAAVESLKVRQSPQADAFLRDHRPWGWFETLALSDRFQVKRIVVNPGAALSLQSHVHRAEHWIVVTGTARVTIDDAVRLVTENQSVYIPLGARHRLENPGKLPMVLIEVQTGAYLGEDDITRYQDTYARED